MLGLLCEISGCCASFVLVTVVEEKLNPSLLMMARFSRHAPRAHSGFKDTSHGALCTERCADADCRVAHGTSEAYSKVAAERAGDSGVVALGRGLRDV